MTLTQAPNAVNISFSVFDAQILARKTEEESLFNVFCKSDIPEIQIETFYNTHFVRSFYDINQALNSENKRLAQAAEDYMARYIRRKANREDVPVAAVLYFTNKVAEGIIKETTKFSSDEVLKQLYPDALKLPHLLQTLMYIFLVRYSYLDLFIGKVNLSEFTYTQPHLGSLQVDTQHPLLKEALFALSYIPLISEKRIQNDLHKTLHQGVEKSMGLYSKEKLESGIDRFCREFSFIMNRLHVHHIVDLTKAADLLATLYSQTAHLLDNTDRLKFAETFYTYYAPKDSLKKIIDFLFPPTEE